MEEHGYKTLLVTSSRPGEGKTTVAANLAMSIALQGKKVILVDGDMWKPSVAQMMNESGKHPGLGAVLKGYASLEDALTTVDIGSSEGSLKVMYGGKSDSDNAKLLSDKKMRTLIEKLSNIADVVVFDTAPCELLVDVSVMTQYIDAAVYVVKYDCTKLSQIRNGLQALSYGKTDILGYVFNSDIAKGNGRYGYRYGNYGSYYGGYGVYGKNDNLSGRVIKD